MAAVHTGLNGFALYRLLRRPGAPGTEHGEFVLLAPRMTVVAAAAIAEGWNDRSREDAEMAEKTAAVATVRR